MVRVSCAGDIVVNCLFIGFPGVFPAACPRSRARMRDARPACRAVGIFVVETVYCRWCHDQKPAWQNVSTVFVFKPLPG